MPPSRRLSSPLIQCVRNSTYANMAVQLADDHLLDDLDLGTVLEFAGIDSCRGRKQRWLCFSPVPAPDKIKRDIGGLLLPVLATRLQFNLNVGNLQWG